MFKVLKKEGHARRGVMETVHGTIQTPVFMNVGTCAAIRGGVSTMESEGNSLSGGAVQHLPSAYPSRR